MTEWFREAFDAEYLALYAHRTQEEAKQAVGMILEIANPASGAKVLDAPCGAGRHSRAFSARGMQVTGLDLSDDLLRAGTREAVQSGQENNMGSPHYVRGDLRQLPFREGTFDLVANLFSSIGYFETDTENAAMLCGLIRVCAPGGVIVVDFMNSPQVRKTLKAHSSQTLDNGTKINSVREISGVPPRVVKSTEAKSPDGQIRTYFESVRLYEPQELRDIMKKCGAPVFDIRGDYRGNNYTPESERVVLFGRKQ